jgi:hypothetical protein
VGDPATTLPNSSGVVLFLQYSTTLFFVWRYRASRLPLVATLIILAMAIIIYLGVSFAFYLETAGTTYIAWYVMAVFKAVGILAIVKWKGSVSFKRTHLIERMTCLTLIIGSTLDLSFWSIQH